MKPVFQVTEKRNLLGGMILLAGVFGIACDARLNSSSRGTNGEIPVQVDHGEGGSHSQSPHSINQRYSPLSQITNEEYAAALSALLEVPLETVQASGLMNTLPVESEWQGLVNAANRQALTQLAISGYANLSTAIADEFVLGDDQSFFDRLGCAEIAVARGISAEVYSSRNCLRDYGERLLRRGFRGAFEDDDLVRLEELLNGLDLILAPLEGASAGPEALEDALVLRFEAVVQLVALSPKFVLLVEKGAFRSDGEVRELSEHEIANRIAFFLTGAPPDQNLVNKALAKSLSGPDGRVEATEELLSSPKSAAGAVDILVRWLGVDESSEETDAASVAQLRSFLLDWMMNQRPFEDFYSAPFPVQLVDGFESEEEFGVFGSRAVVASNTSAPTPSFINRGEFITERLLCAKLPEDLPDAALEGDPRTPLEVFEVHAASACATCHHVFDNYGAALQRFDLDTNLYDPNGDELGTSFELFPIGDVAGTISDPKGLGRQLGSSSQAQLCMVKLWYRHAVRRDLLSNEADEEHIERLFETWSTSGDTSLRALLRVIVADEDFARLIP